MSEETNVLSEMEKQLPVEPQRWIFTFGYNHLHPDGYCVGTGSHAEARQKMHERYGAKWAFQYENEKQAGVEEYHLRFVEEF